MSLIEEVFANTGLLIAEDCRDSEEIHYSRRGERSTDAIKIIVLKNGSCKLLIEITGKNSERYTYEHDSIISACAMFEALHTFRDECVKPFIDSINDNI